MKTSYKQTLERLYSREPSTAVFDRVNAKIEYTRTVHARIKALSYGVVTLVTLLALVPVFQYSSTQANYSGFYEYASLFISDSSYMLNNWKITIFSVVESLPMTGIALTLGTLLTSVYAFKKSVANIKMSNISHLLIRA